MAFPVTVPFWLQKIYSKFVWSYPASQAIYLSFDDGPIPELTPWVLEQLKAFNAKATFFCVGNNAQKHPELIQQILAEGHAVGNHTQSHLKGWTTNKRKYLRDFIKAKESLPETKLFRPPYGKIKRRQAKAIAKQNTIIMWSVLSKDYDKTISEQQCLANSLQTKAGDIVVFHDNLKAEQNLKYALPRFLAHYTQQNIPFKTLNQQHEH